MSYRCCNVKSNCIRPPNYTPLIFNHSPSNFLTSALFHWQDGGDGGWEEGCSKEEGGWVMRMG